MLITHRHARENHVLDVALHEKMTQYLNPGAGRLSRHGNARAEPHVLRCGPVLWLDRWTCGMDGARHAGLLVVFDSIPEGGVGGCETAPRRRVGTALLARHWLPPPVPLRAFGGRRRRGRRGLFSPPQSHRDVTGTSTLVRVSCIARFQLTFASRGLSTERASRQQRATYPDSTTQPPERTLPRARGTLYVHPASRTPIADAPPPQRRRPLPELVPRWP